MGRLRKKPWAAEYLNKSKIVETQPNKMKDKWSIKKFPKNQPLWIEIGMGKGDFANKQAEINPDVNIIGIEKYSSVQIIPVKKSEQKTKDNLRFISGDAAEILQWFNEKSLDKIFINFPDPWPKKRHEKRRLLFHTFLNDYYKLLKPGMYIEFKTDQLSLFEFAIKQVKEKTKFIIKNENRDLHKKNSNIITTEYDS